MTTIRTAPSFVVFNPALDRRAQAVRKPRLSPQCRLSVRSTGIPDGP